MIISEPGTALFITVNGPGELYYWVKPLLDALSTLSPAPAVWVFLTPCQFSSGREEEVVQHFPLVQKVFSPPETLRFCFGRDHIQYPRQGVVLFLGGDLFYSVRLKKRTGYPLWVYGSLLKWFRSVDRYLARFHRDYEKYSFSKKTFVGDLLRSYVSDHLLDHSLSERFFPPGEPRILFLPGSRKNVYSLIIDFYTQVARSFRGSFSEASFVMSFPSHYQSSDMGEITGDSRSIPFYFGKTSELMVEADLTITVPGSNNLELAYRKKKGIVILPLDVSEKYIPLTGLPGLIEKIPFIGHHIKKRIIHIKNAHMKWVSLPNILLDREILKELRGKVTPEMVAVEAAQLLETKDTPIDFPEDDFPLSVSRDISQMIRETLVSDGKK
ncbi:MAG: hypothetical protein WCP87_03240 [Atribacterota bacterium]|nr:hypothetical protein [Candidatus Atribacteria bacterium]